MLYCDGVPNAPAGFWSRIATSLLFQQVCIIKKTQHKAGQSIKGECLYKGKRERYRVLDLHISCALFLLHLIFRYTLIKPRRKEIASSSKLAYIFFFAGGQPRKC